MFQKYHALRATGIVTLVAFMAGCLAPTARSARRLWGVYLAAHALHASLLVRAAGRHGGASFSKTSRYGGAAGYAAVAALAAGSYVPGAPRGVVQRAGQHVLFGLYAFTIVHGYLAKGRDRRVYGPLAALWIAAALRRRNQGPDEGTGPVREAASSTFVTV